jgi:hypothetical protein
MKAFILLLLTTASAHAQVLPIQISPIPEPSTIALIAGAAGVALLRHIKRKR